MKRVTIKNFDELVTVFPSLTVNQIIVLYRAVLDMIDVVECKLGSASHEESNTLVKQLEDLIKADALLSGYLARYCCQLCGF